jgi:hypothetical protein
MRRFGRLGRPHDESMPHPVSRQSLRERLVCPLFEDAVSVSWLRRNLTMRDSVDVVFLIGILSVSAASNASNRRLVLGSTNRVGMVRREDDHVRRSARVANSVRRDSSACAARSLESSADGRRRCVADVRDASTLLMLVAPRPALAKSRATACQWVTGPR